MKVHIIKALVIMLTIIVIVSSCLISPMNVNAATTYDSSAALSYAAAHWKDGVGLCAEFVSNCIKAGGCSAWSASCTALRTQLLNSGMGTEYKLNLESDMSIKASNYTGKLSAGDVVFYYCPGCVSIDGLPYIHAVLCNGMDANGYMKAYAHNRANSGEKKYCYSSKCYECKTTISAAYVYHFNGNVGTTSYNPQGVFDEVTSQYGKIRVRGWAFDRDSLGESLKIQVYVGGTPESGAPGYVITANQSRTDVDAAYPGVGVNHGFDSTIKVSARGETEIYVYAMSVGGGYDTLLGTKTVNITNEYSISVDTDNLTLKTGETKELNFSFTGDNVKSMRAGSNNNELISLEEWGEIDWAEGTGSIKLKGVDPGEIVFALILVDEDVNYLYVQELKITIVQPVLYIGLNDTSLNVGETEQLKVKVYPSTSTNKNIIWSSSNTNVVTVSEGTITAKSAGTATITATAEDGSGATDTCTVTVTQPVTDLSLSKTSATLNVGATETLSLTVSPSNATNKSVTWSSSDTNVATVSDGTVTAKSAGTATITATAADGSGKSASCTVTVEQTTWPEKVTIGDGFDAIIQGIETNVILNNVNNEVQGNNQSITNDSWWHFELQSDGSYEIKSKANGYNMELLNGEDSNGNIIHLAEDNNTTAQRWYLYGNDITGYYLRPLCSNFATLDLRDGEAQLYTLYKGEEQQFYIRKNLVSVATWSCYPKVYYTGEPTKMSITVWEGDYTLVENVDYTLTYDNHEKVGTASVTVTGIGKYVGTIKNFYEILEAQVANVSLNTNILNFNDTGLQLTLAYTISPNYAVAKEVIWSSSNTNVATVSNGVVTAIAPGSAVITVNVDGKTADCNVTVKRQAAGVTLNSSSLSLKVNDTFSLVATVAPADASDKNITWSTSDSTVAKVEAGKVTALKSGTATITATTVNGKQASCTVTVKQVSEDPVTWPDSVMIYDGNFMALIQGVDTNTFLGYENDTVQGRGQTEDENSEWYFELQSDGSYEIKAFKAGVDFTRFKNLELKNGEDYSGNAICLAEDNDSEAQRWFLYGDEDTGYYLRPVCSTFGTLDLRDETAELYGYQKGVEQKFNIKVYIGWVTTMSYLSIADYTGNPITPQFQITRNDIPLVENVDYTVKYENNIEVGTGKVIITGIGKYVGSRTFDFEISVIDIESVGLNRETIAFTDTGLQQDLNYYITPYYAVPEQVTWTSSDTNVATVKDGVVTAVAPGSAVITVNVDGKMDSCIVNVMEEQQEIRFGDVSVNSWQYAPAIYVYEKGIMTGKGFDVNGDVVFDPEAALSREQFAQILYSAEGKPLLMYSQIFTDIADGQWYTSAVLWAANKGIVSGYGDGRYGVSDSITREQLAAMLYKYAEYKGYDTTARASFDKFADQSQISSWAANQLSWAVANGVMSGKGEKLDPQGSATRAECAAMLRTFMETFEG